MQEMILLALAVAPGLAIAFYIYERDKLDREPLQLLVFSFILGALSIFPAIILELAGGKFGYSEAGFFGNRNPMDILKYSLIVGFSEEFCKYLVVRSYAYPKKAFNEPFDGITYAVMVSLGFATLENIFYVVQGGYGIGLLRMFTAVPGHASFGVLMGYFIGLAKFRNGSFWLKLTGLLAAIAFHTAYDFFLFVNNGSLLFLGAFLALAIGIRLSMRAMHLHNKNSPFALSEQNPIVISDFPETDPNIPTIQSEPSADRSPAGEINRGL